MRKIKFDAIYKPTGEHFNPIEINFNDNTITGNFDGKIKDWCIFSLDGKRGDVILRQYTGLKDKNGKEIYEGDIDSDGKNLSVICYIERYGAYCAVPLSLYLHENYEGEVIYQYGYDCYFHNCTPERYLNIIGNIYENPELLQT